MKKEIKSISRKIIFRIYTVTKIKFLLGVIGVNVGRNVRIFKSEIKPLANIGDEVDIINSKLIGNFEINSRTEISGSYLSGRFTISNDCVVTNSKMTGNFFLGEKSCVNDLSGSGDIITGHNLRIIGGSVNLHGDIEIGNYTSINGPNTDIYTTIYRVKVGNFCSIARNVNIQEYNHKTNKVSTYFTASNIFGLDSNFDKESKGEIVIENDVWIGSQCVILTGSRISNGAVIAANSVVKGYIPPYAIAGGSPAKVIKYRFDGNTINKLLEIKWWEWNYEKLKSNTEFLTSEIIDFNLIK